MLDGLARAVDAGLLTELEVRLASEVYDDVFEEASDLLNANHLACAAILMRVGLENGLRRAASREGMADADTAKAAGLNQWLWKMGKLYPQATFDQVSSWLAIGNAYAHNTPDAVRYKHADVARTLKDARGFLATLLV